MIKQPTTAILSILMTIALLQTVSTAQAKDGEQSVYQKVIEKKEITCGYFTWVPYVVKDPNTGTLSGINYEFMEEIGKILGFKINWTEEVSAGTALEGLQTKRYDVMCATLWPDTARLQNSLMSNPEFFSTVHVIVRKDDKRFDGNAALLNSPDITIAGIDGDVTFTVAKEKFPKAKILSIAQTSNGSELLENLVTRKADAVILDEGSIADFNRANQNSVRLASGIDTVATFPESLAVRKGETELIDALNHALATLKANKFNEQTIAKYKAYGYTVGK